MSMDSFAIILVQLLSLSMGIAYDDINRCHCPGAVCIMNPDAIHSEGVKTFSNCSMQDFARFTLNQASQCLQNQPSFQISYKTQLCGNKKKDDGEDCDCGTEEECDKIQPVCCEAATCKLKKPAKCWEGECCMNCTLKPKGDICRHSFDECDISEFCNGTGAYCQTEDIFVMNGTPCQKNKWVCMEGRCMSPDFQCSDTFGEGVIGVIEEHLAQFNSRTDIFGNCGITESGYTPCETKDQKCGKLICLYNKRNINTNENATTIYVNIDGKIYVSAEYPPDHKDNKKMWVRDGTICDQNKVCKDKRCVDATVLGYNCRADQCNNRGVCTNKNQCHCQPEYEPPDCANPVLRGKDAHNEGRAQFVPIPDRYYVEGPYHTEPKKWPFFLIIPFFIIFSVLIAIVVKIYFQRKKWRTEEYISDEELESENEHTDSKEKTG